MCLGRVINPLRQYYFVSKMYLQHCDFWYQCQTVILSTSIIIIFDHYIVLLTGDSVTLPINIIYSVWLETPPPPKLNLKTCPNQ
jgi:hypothetical protein